VTSSVTQPVKQLRGFQRITLAPHEKRTVKFTLTPHSFELWNLDMHRVVEPGEVTIMTGANSADLKSATLTITG
jgi:beta-glucosidase